MKFFVDENIPLVTVKELVLQGYDVVDIRGTDDRGISDEVLWQKAQDLCDQGFAYAPKSGFQNTPHLSLGVLIHFDT